MSDVAPLAAQTLAQDTHIDHSPGTHSIAPPTAAEATFDRRPRRYHDDLDSGDDRTSISSSVLDPPPRQRRPLPPLPDLRFEQSYMASIAPAGGVWWKIALITLKDQVFMPLLQGLGFNLALFAWRWWNRGVKFSGAGVGGGLLDPPALMVGGGLTGCTARVRRWWWETNNWKIPTQ
jgi:hypothetical protein